MATASASDPPESDPGEEQPPASARSRLGAGLITGASGEPS
ncbi:hypothetical protein [Azohydromonas lata]|nr:hypothetical protein [Azohydromonas lata]